MKTKQKFILAAIILTFLEIGCLFTPCVYKLQLRLYGEYGSGHLAYEGGRMFFHMTNFQFLNLLEWIVFLSMIASIVIMFAMYKDIQHPYMQFAPYALVVSFLMFLLTYVCKAAFAETSRIGVESMDAMSVLLRLRYDWDLNWMFFVLLALHIVSILMVFASNPAETAKIFRFKISGNIHK